MNRHAPTLTDRRARKGACVTAWAALLASLFSVPAIARQTYNEVGPQARGLDVREHLGAPLPMEVELVDADGKKVRLGDYFTHTASDGTVVQGKPAIVALVYYSCPVICTTLVNTLVDCARGIDSMTLGKDYQMLFFSYDPRDLPVAAAGKRNAAVRGYGRGETDEIKDGIRFHAGSEETGRQLANAFGYEYRQQPSGEYAHPIVFFAVTPDGKIARYLYSFGHTPQQIKLAVLEAGSGQVTQSLPDRLLTFCYMYDPKIGRYTMNAVRVMQLGGVLTVVSLGSLIGGLLIAERIRKRRRKIATKDGLAKGLTDGTIPVH
ncbi:MAG: SCO family protein [Planctomycetota bacterium]